jgi:SWI/SNF-related matrix-associated actin-dependent regulator 1 of chromatin subfamily A
MAAARAALAARALRAERALERVRWRRGEEPSSEGSDAGSDDAAAAARSAEAAARGALFRKAARRAQERGARRSLPRALWVWRAATLALALDEAGRRLTRAAAGGRVAALGARARFAVAPPRLPQAAAAVAAAADAAAALQAAAAQPAAFVSLPAVPPLPPGADAETERVWHAQQQLTERLGALVAIARAADARAPSLGGVGARAQPGLNGGLSAGGQRSAAGSRPGSRPVSAASTPARTR